MYLFVCRPIAGITVTGMHSRNLPEFCIFPENLLNYLKKSCVNVCLLFFILFNIYYVECKLVLKH